MALPDDVDARMLDQEVRTELRSLVKETAETVARHLVVTGQLIDGDPERALAHARAARALAGRVGSVREACGLAAYAAGEWAEGLAELRAARRITGLPSHLAVMADCERALGRPERCLAYGDDRDVTRLEQDARVELVIVLAGARRDLGQLDAAVLQLQEPAKRTTARRPWAVRLWYAYADALLAAGREEQAREWFSRTAELDSAGATDAADRLLELDGFVLEGGDDPDDDVPGAEGGEPLDLTALVAGVGTKAVPSAASDQPRGEPPAAPAETVQGAAETVHLTGATRQPDEDEVLQDEVLQDEVLQDEVLQDEVLQDEVPEGARPAAPSGVGAAPFTAPAPAEEVLAPPAGERVPTVTFQPAEPDDDGEMRLFD